MTTQTFGKQHLVRTFLFAAIVAVLAVTSVQRASANQSGPSINDQVEFQIALCEGAGGTASVDSVVRTPGNGLSGVLVRCHGGLLDGMTCATGPAGSECFWPARPAGGSHGTRPTTSVNDVDSGQVLMPIDAVADPATTGQPSVDQPVTGDVTADPGTVTDPIVSDDGGAVVDQPVVADETGDPNVAGDQVDTDQPVIEPAYPVETTTTPGTLIDPIQYDQPILIGQ
jgi:hypothetical protein